MSIHMKWMDIEQIWAVKEQMKQATTTNEVHQKQVDAANWNEVTVCIELTQLTGNQCYINLCHSIWRNA